MDWLEEMKAGMQMIQSACSKNDGHGDEYTATCSDCPFNDYCDELFNKYDIPEKWNLEEMEE